MGVSRSSQSRTGAGSRAADSLLSTCSNASRSSVQRILSYASANVNQP